ncbi:hypothetical protein AMJ86_02210 [bacterium SM23_57]|nr:MAG: hypothetical protein AMJ86_02210 [bacterium SM23_57]
MRLMLANPKSPSNIVIRHPAFARTTLKFTVVMVLPTPPFPEQMLRIWKACDGRVSGVMTDVFDLGNTLGMLISFYGLLVFSPYSDSTLLSYRQRLVSKLAIIVRVLITSIKEDTIGWNYAIDSGVLGAKI